MAKERKTRKDGEKEIIQSRESLLLFPSHSLLLCTSLSNEQFSFFLSSRRLFGRFSFASLLPFFLLLHHVSPVYESRQSRCVSPPLSLSSIFLSLSSLSPYTHFHLGCSMFNASLLLSRMKDSFFRNATSQPGEREKAF